MKGENQPDDISHSFTLCLNTAILDNCLISIGRSFHTEHPNTDIECFLWTVEYRGLLSLIGSLRLTLCMLATKSKFILQNTMSFNTLKTKRAANEIFVCLTFNIFNELNKGAVCVYFLLNVIVLIIRFCARINGFKCLL